MSIPIPARPALRGHTFYQQVFASDAGTNPLGVIASNGGAARVGAS